MKKLIILIAFLNFGIVASNEVMAQCDTIANICIKNIKDGFISDGQNYRALLLEDEVAEFQSTFFGGSVYRIAACSGSTNGNLIFSIYDTKRNLLYNSADHKNAPYWDFKFKNTMDCIIEAKLNHSTSSGSGCAVILIGFKQLK
jgi:hypothetical protein